MLETAANENAEQQTISSQNSAKNKIVDMTNENSIKQVFGEKAQTAEDDSDANRITDPYSKVGSEQAGFQNAKHQSQDSNDPANLYRMNVPLGDDHNQASQHSPTQRSEQNLHVRAHDRSSDASDAGRSSRHSEQGKHRHGGRNLQAQNERPERTTQQLTESSGTQNGTSDLSSILQNAGSTLQSTSADLQSIGSDLQAVSSSGQSASVTTELPQVASELQTIGSLLQTTNTDLEQFSSQLASMMEGGKTGNSSGTSGPNGVGENSAGSGVSGGQSTETSGSTVESGSGASGGQSTETTGSTATGGGSTETAMTPSTWASTGNGSPTFSDPVISELDQTDPHIAQTLTDSQLSMTAAGYNQYEGIVAQNVQAGVFPDDESLMQASAYELGEKGGSQSDVQAAETAITKDLGPKSTPGDAAVSTFQGGTGNGDSSTGAAGSSGTGGTSGDTGSGSGGNSSGSGDSGTTSVSSSVTQTIQAQEASDSTLATTLKAAQSAMSSSGYGQLENFLAQNNPDANPNADAPLMSAAVSQAGLSSSDSTALQNTEIADMPEAQVLTYANQTDPSLYNTLINTSERVSSSGWQDVENYLVNNYTGDNSMDSTLMSNVLNQSGLGSADQSTLTSVLKTDMPAALSSDPFAAGLQSTDSTMAKTLTDAAGAMSSSGYQQLELYVEDNYTGDTSSDNAIMSNARSQAGLSSSDVSALTGVLKTDMPGALSSSTSSGGSSETGSGGSSETGSGGSSETGSGGSSETGSGGSSETGSGGSSETGSGGSSETGSGGSSETGSGGGNPSSTTTFEAGGSTLLEPPKTSSGLVTPVGSMSGDNTAYQGSIQGTINGANNVKASSATEGQGNGSDALTLSPVSVITSMDTKTGQGFQQKYGYFEADIKLGQTNGKVDPNQWPGWYLESSAHVLDPSAAPSAEIDIMEAQTSDTDGEGDTAYNAGVHRNSSVNGEYGNGSVADKDQGPYVTGLTSISSGYNVYGVNWQPNDKNIEFYYDGQEVGYNPVYDTTNNSPAYMTLDMINGGWSTSDPNAKGGEMQVAWVRAYQNANLVNSANDPNGTVGTTITDTNPDDSPPALSQASDGGSSTQKVTWVNTFNTDFTQASDYTTDTADETAAGSPSKATLTSDIISTQGGGAQDTPWYEGQWMVDQGTNTLSGGSAGMSTTPGANG